MRRFIFFSVLILLNSCIGEIDRYLDAKHIELKKISSFPEDAGVSTSWSIYENECTLNIKIDKSRITETAFDTSEIPVYSLKAVFFDGQDVLKLNPGYSKYCSGAEINKNGYFIIEQRNDYYEKFATANFVFPMYLFHNVKAGKNNLYMGIILSKVVGNSNYQLYKGFFSFKIEVPEIYCSTLICKGLELQCDSIWSPYSSDFSFGKGLPDVYWAICMPSADSNDVSRYYASTPVIWNTYGYQHTDTIDLFTYKDDEELLIGVYDYDRVFSDEYIGSWHGKLTDLYNNKSDSISFTHVTSFKYEFKTPAIINAQKK